MATITSAAFTSMLKAEMESRRVKAELRSFLLESLPEDKRQDQMRIWQLEDRVKDLERAAALGNTESCRSDSYGAGLLGIGIGISLGSMFGG